MGISVSCAGCGAPYTVNDNLAGKKVRCKQCGQVMRVPLGDDALEVVEEPPSVPQLPRPPAAISLTPPKPRKKLMESAAPQEGITAMLLFAHFGVLAILTLRLLVSAEHRFAAGGPAAIIVHAALLFGGFLLLVAPSMLLAVFVASRLAGMAMPDQAYLRSAGITSVPYIFIYSAVLIISLFAAPGELLDLSGWNAVLGGIVLGAKIGVFLLCMYVFAFSIWRVLLMNVVAFVPLVITSMIVGLAAFGARNSMGKAYQVAQARAAEQERHTSAQPTRGSSPAPAPSRSASASNRPTGGGLASAPQVDSRDARASAIRRRLDSLAGRIASDSRETLEALLPALDGDLSQLQGHASVAELQRTLSDLRDRIAREALSEAPDPRIFQPPASADRWAADQASLALLDDEVSFGGYRLRPPKDALLDLSLDAAKGLTWTIGPRPGQAASNRNAAKLTISTAERGNLSQLLPWVASKPFQLRRAEADKLLVVNAAGADVSSGTMNGLSASRVATLASGNQRSVKYLVPCEARWMIVEILLPSGDEGHLALLESSARTLRASRPDEPIADPFAVDRIARRLVDSPGAAAAILKTRGAAAEAAVAPYLDAKETAAQAAALEVLASVGTEKSLPAVKRLARSDNGSVRDAARAAWKYIAPKEMDDVAAALMDLESAQNFIGKKAAIEVLAKASADERKARVAPMLEAVLLARDSESFHLYDIAADALAVWATPKSALNVAAKLNDNSGSPFGRRAVLRVLGELKDPKTAPVVARWILLETELAEKALTNMGAGAEEEVIKLLNNREAKIRLSGARILETIGTRKSIYPLSVALKDNRDPLAAEAARRAWETVRERVAAAASETK